MNLNFEKEMDPRNMRHIKFSNKETHERFLQFKISKVRDNWDFLRFPLHLL